MSFRPSALSFGLSLKTQDYSAQDFKALQSFIKQHDGLSDG